MGLKFFAIPAMRPGEAEAEMNAFLRGHRVVSLRSELVMNDGGRSSASFATRSFGRRCRPASTNSTAAVTFARLLTSSYPAPSRETGARLQSTRSPAA